MSSPLNTLGMAKDAQDSSSEKDEAEAQRRLGAMVAEARKKIGHSNREEFAATANVSVRVLSDLEAGTRSNFSARIISSVESGVGWPSGTIDQILTDPNFVPPEPLPASGELIYQAPKFKRQPVQVEVATVERTISLLADVSKALTKDKKPATVSDALQRVSAQAISLCWPYIIRLVEDNCFPGNELHPAVRPIYEAFLARQAEFAPDETAGLYAQWLAGDFPDAPEKVRRRYMERWNESR
ncbi:helix-turn-helix domain-containing protein [Mycobacteroides abscessus]|uniref:helix-turn-helix domain-containing protein n=1 Tax=Mycobacteroides abscessus TaxID=36809 RepID=UPI001F4525E5|nr:helix-turn-helix transcriptional regulator [Mycobacteroides abscessus]